MPGNTKPTCSLRNRVSWFSFIPDRSVPPRMTRPDEGLSSPAAQCRNVLLPEPDGPITAVKLPYGMVTETGRSSGTSSTRPCFSSSLRW